VAEADPTSKRRRPLLCGERGTFAPQNCAKYSLRSEHLQASSFAGYHDFRRTTNISKENSDSLKGILILLVIIGHNTIISEITPQIFQVLYNFHVIGFLLLPFISLPKALTKKNIINISIRYYIPLLWYFTIAFIIYNFFLYKHSFDFSISEKYFITGIIGSARLFDQNTGFQLFWFLPALFSLVLLKMIFYHVSKPIRIMLLFIFIIIHFIAGNLSETVKTYIPFGLLISAYCFVLGLVTSWIWKRMVSKNMGILNIFFISSFIII